MEFLWKSTARRMVSCWMAIVLLIGLVPMTAAALPDAPWVAATGAVVMDVDTGEIYYEKNGSVARPVASMTKLMSLYLVFDEIDAGRLTLDSQIVPSPLAVQVSNNWAYSGLERLRADRTYSVRDLLSVIMTRSANGSVIALAEHISGTEAAFVQRMNAKAASWGMKATFADCTGFTDQGNSVTPLEMAKIARRIIVDHPEILEFSSLKSCVFQGSTYYTTNTLMRYNQVEGIDGLKTGCTDGAGYCFTGTAQRDGARILAVAMNSTSYANRMADVQTLLEYGFRCRAEREKQWESQFQHLSLHLNVQGDLLWPYVENKVTYSVTTSNISMPVTATWKVDGKVVQVQEDLWLRTGEEIALGLAPEYRTGSVPVSLMLELPNGTARSVSRSMEVSQEKLDFQGNLGMTDVTVYQGSMSFTIPAQVRCTQGKTVTIPVGWYLDGQVIPGFHGDGFRLSPQGSSAYTLNTKNLTVGDHVLEFRCNDDQWPGMEAVSLTLNIHVLGKAA